MNRLRPTIDLSYGDQEVLQRVLAEVFFQVVENLPDPEPEQTQEQVAG